MKQKLHKIIFIIVVALFIGSVASQAQLYNNSPNSPSVEQKDINIGLFNDDDGWGDNVEGPDGGAGQSDLPVGEGIALLTLLSGAYALIKRNVGRKK